MQPGFLPAVVDRCALRHRCITLLEHLFHAADLCGLDKRLVSLKVDRIAALVAFIALDDTLVLVWQRDGQTPRRAWRIDCVVLVALWARLAAWRNA